MSSRPGELGRKDFIEKTRGLGKIKVYQWWRPSPSGLGFFDALNLMVSYWPKRARGKMILRDKKRGGEAFLWVFSRSLKSLYLEHLCV